MSAGYFGGVKWLFLDSLQEVNAVRGSLGMMQRMWLIKLLEADEAPAIVCVHHNPERSLVGLTDAEEFLDIVLPRRRVKLVLFGHTHEYRTWNRDGLHFVNLPATGYAFRPDARLGWLLARVRRDGMEYEFRGIGGGASAGGGKRELEWRGDA